MYYINKNPLFKKTIDNELNNIGLIETNNLDVNEFAFCDIQYNDKDNPIYEKCKIINQFKDINILGNKKDQYINFLNFYQNKPNYIPFTLPFNREKLDDVYNLLYNTKKIYIIKPENEAFRSGVTIIRNISELIKHLEEFDKYNDWIIQEYIDNPLLINNKKFHFRIDVLYIQNKSFKVAYMSKLVDIHISKSNYIEGNYDNDRILSGYKSYPLNGYFYEYFGEDKWKNIIYPQVKKIITETLNSVVDKLECINENQTCYKVFGYDILINNNFDCFLAEINAKNALYSRELKESFISAIVKLVLSNKSYNNYELKLLNFPFETILYKKNITILVLLYYLIIIFIILFLFITIFYLINIYGKNKRDYWRKYI